MKKSKNNRKNIQQVTAPAIRIELSSSADWQKSRGYSDIARPDDDILRKHGYNIKIYRSLLSDEQVKACFLNQRIAGVIASPWDIKPASDEPQDIEIAEFVKETIENLPFNEICRKMLYATWFGFQVGEVLWNIKDNRIIIENIKVRRVERFCFKPSGELCLVNNYVDKQIMPDRKFWVLKNSGDNDDDIYGIGLAHICYWPVYLKRNGLKFWSILVEKFAIPTAVGKYPLGCSIEDIREILQSLDSIASETSIAVPEGTAVELLEAVKSSGGDHEKFCTYLDKIIAKAILGQDGTSQNGAYEGTAKVQENVKDLVLKADSDLLCESFNEVIKWLVSYNWPGAEAPKITRSFEQPENLKEAAEQDTLIYNMGFDPSEEYINNKYSGDWQKRQAITLPQEQPADFAETDETDNTAEDMAADWERVMTPLVSPIDEILQSCSSFTEFEEKLLQAYPNMDIGKFQELTANANFTARIAGAVGVQK